MANVRLESRVRQGVRLAWLVMAALVATPASAQDFYWNADGTSSPAAGGTGTWSTTAGTLWRRTTNTGTAVAWVSSGTSDAFFAGTSGTVTVSGTPGLRHMNFLTNGYEIAGTGTLRFLATGTINTAAGVTATISAPTSRAAGVQFVKGGAGTLVLKSDFPLLDNSAATNGAVRRGALVIAGGSFGAIAGSGTLGPRVEVFDGSSLRQSGGQSGMQHTLQMSDGASLLISGGTMSATNMFRAGFVSSGVLMQTGGDFVFRPQNNSGLNEVFRFNSTSSPVQHSAAYATGGVADFRLPSVGGAGYAVVLNNSTLTAASTAQLTLANTADWRIAGLRVGYQAASGTAAVSLNGGSLTITGSVWGDSGVNRFNFDGGTLRAGTNSATFFGGFTAATVYDGGGTIDTNGYNVTVAQPLLAASGSGVTSISVTNGGSGYVSPPVVLLSGGGGAGATAVAILDEATGTVSQVVITNSGTGYTSAPSITLVSSTSQPPTTAATFGTPSIAANATTGGITKSGDGRLTLTGTSTYAGATSVTTGTLWVNGRLANTSGVTVSTGATLGGTGSIAAAISGSGLVSPGMSPGITTATQVNPSGGLDFAFEFTATGSPTYGSAGASVNDVLRITNTGTPFTATLGAGNVVNVYFDVAALAENDAFRGGFYTDAGSDFISSIQGATYAFWVRGNGGGGTSFNGVNYYSLSAYDPLLGVDVTTVAATANFGSGNVNGRVTEFTILAVVPEPSTLAALVTAAAAVPLCLRCRRRR